MKSSSTETQDFDYLKVLHTIFFTAMMVSCMLNNSLAQAASAILSDYRLATAGDKFSGTVQFAAAFTLRPPRRLRAKRMELVVGMIATSQQRTDKLMTVERQSLDEKANHDVQASPISAGNHSIRRLALLSIQSQPSRYRRFAGA